MSQTQLKPCLMCEGTGTQNVRSQTIKPDHCWFQSESFTPHYDLTASKRALALEWAKLHRDDEVTP